MPPKRFSAEDFVNAALAILKELPSGDFTLKSVGERIGADTTAIYRHFPGKDALLSAMVDRVLADFVAPMEPGADPRAEIGRIALGIRDLHLRFPMLAATIAGTRIIAPNAVKLSQRSVDILMSLGLEGDKLVTAYQAMENYILGSNWNDGVGIPNNWEIRRLRYELIDRAPFSSLSKARVGELSDRAYLEGLWAMLDRAVGSSGVRK